MKKLFQMAYKRKSDAKRDNEGKRISIHLDKNVTDYEYRQGRIKVVKNGKVIQNIFFGSKKELRDLIIEWDIRCSPDYISVFFTDRERNWF